jgi:hypothetical protein
VIATKAELPKLMLLLIAAVDCPAYYKKVAVSLSSSLKLATRAEVCALRANGLRFCSES